MNRINPIPVINYNASTPHIESNVRLSESKGAKAMAFHMHAERIVWQLIVYTYIILRTDSHKNTQ